MRQRVESYGISKEDVDTIVKKVEEGHYQVSPALALQKRQVSFANSKQERLNLTYSASKLTKLLARWRAGCTTPLCTGGS